MMKRKRSVTVVLAALVPVMILSLGNGCTCNKKDDDDKPAPSATVAPPAPTPTAPVAVVPEEDAGAPVDAGIDAAKPRVGPGGGGAPGSIAKCCAALQQNANSAPMEQKGYYMAAASACNGLRNTPSAQQAFGQLRAFLAGAKMPGACTGK
jgi:hypothetical protein